MQFKKVEKPNKPRRGKNAFTAEVPALVKDGEARGFDVKAETPAELKGQLLKFRSQFVAAVNSYNKEKKTTYFPRFESLKPGDTREEKSNATTAAVTFWVEDEDA